MSEYKTVPQTQLIQIGPKERSDMVSEILPLSFSWVYRMNKTMREVEIPLYNIDPEDIIRAKKKVESFKRRQYLIADEWIDRIMDPAKKGTDLAESLYSQ